VSRGLGKLPYKKLKGIQVEIDAPCRSDPGQKICLWKKCLDLAGLLEQADSGLPNVEIHLKDSHWPSGLLTASGKNVAVDRVKSNPPRNSVTDRLKEQTYTTNEEYQIALTVFHRLRNVQTANVYLPEDMVCDNEFADNMETVLVQKEAFGTLLDAGDPWNDKSLQGNQDMMFMDLNIELDLLPSITANMMRLERFSSRHTRGLGSGVKVREGARKDFEDSHHQFLQLQ
jgi:hypothetical protein